MCVCIYIYIHLHICIHTHIFVDSYKCVCVCVCVCVYICVSMGVCLCLWVYANVIRHARDGRYEHGQCQPTTRVRHRVTAASSGTRTHAGARVQASRPCALWRARLRGTVATGGGPRRYWRGSPWREWYTQPVPFPSSFIDRGRHHGRGQGHLQRQVPLWVCSFYFIYIYVYIYTPASPPEWYFSSSSLRVTLLCSLYICVCVCECVCVFVYR